tara:strand:- start:1246 stop:1437 length:192 start_codon:yes stop_codon:yes gene_type:complete
MKFHPTLIEKLVETYEVYSGWRDQVKLKKALSELNIAVYTRQDGIQILVNEDELNKVKRNTNK